MLKYFKNKKFRKSAAYILKHSDLINPKDCMIVDNILFEKLKYKENTSRDKKSGEICKYRFFVDVDDYDYLQVNTYLKCEKLVAALDLIFKERKI